MASQAKFLEEVYAELNKLEEVKRINEGCQSFMTKIEECITTHGSPDAPACAEAKANGELCTLAFTCPTEYQALYICSDTRGSKDPSACKKEAQAMDNCIAKFRSKVDAVTKEVMKRQQQK